MPQVSRSPLYDPASHPYPKIIYRSPGQTQGGVTVNSEEEELAILTAWDEQDKAKEGGKTGAKSEPAKAKP